MERSEQQRYYKSKILDAKNLPTLPVVLQEAMAVMSSNKSSMVKVAAIIGRDQVLSTKVLKMVNSPVYGFPGRISSIQNALVLLGFNVVKGMIISTVAVEYMVKNMVSLRNHSLACSTAARELGKFLRVPNVEDFVTAGLLHDFGKVIISTQLPEKYKEVIRLVSIKDMQCVDAEREVLGFSHEQVNSWVGALWNLPGNLTDAMRFHHRPMRAETHLTLTCGVHVANFFSRLFECGSPEDDHISYLDPLALKHLGITQRSLSHLLDSLGGQLALYRNSPTGK